MSNLLLVAVLSRLKLVTASDTDAALSKALGVSPQTLSSWKVRNSIPYSLCVDLAARQGISLDWLLMGEGPQLRQADIPAQHQAWEQQHLAQLRSLNPGDLQVILASVQDKLRLDQLERQVDELTRHLGAST
ncbi:bacteriophage CI repressor [Pseudomonas capeferrum]|uniref:helix-turn-helix domain-containing protein n=1 Tax=Pseudomonas capeferrum TaxID=1495066 RepID=UPI0015E39BCB|nr:helix-turn-helix domain-containing protein [Pseudomonas capeferrum]MBA1205223.1 bacteriophage CI repressor [Pseudomonas capeferrum]